MFAPPPQIPACPRPAKRGGIPPASPFLLVTLAMVLAVPAFPAAPNPGKAAELSREALDLLRAGRLDEALTTLREAQALDPSNAQVMNIMGWVLKEQGRLEEAIKAFEKAVELKPDYPGALYNLAEAFAVQGELEKARVFRQRAARYRAGASSNNSGAAPTVQGGERGTAEPENDGLRFAVQVAAYEDRAVALALAKQLTTEYRYTALVDPVEVRAKTIYRVRIRVGSEAEARGLAERLEREQSLDTWIVSVPD